MINFKNRAEVLPSAIILCSILILLGTLGFMIFVPAPGVAGQALKNENNKRKLENDIDSAKQRTQEAKAAVAARVWSGTQDAVMASVMAKLSQRSAAGHVQISAFRPQKPVVVQNMSELPFTVQISGTYPTVLRFLNGLDTPENKMALRSIQIASADGATSAVNATAGLSVYMADNGAAAGAPPPSAAGSGSAARTTRTTGTTGAAATGGAAGG